jgi:uncharacterized OB-fold protein
MSSGGNKMSGQPPFTIEQFYKYISQGKLAGGKCRKCGKIHLPPRPLCDRCFSEEFEWTEMPQKGRLLTYTIIHVAPPQFQQMTPYAVGIIQLENGLKIPGMIKDTEHEKIKVGMRLTIEFDTSAVQSQWPQWPRYHFKPTQQ